MLILTVFRKESNVVIKTMAHTLKNTMHIFFAALLTNLFMLIINLVKKLFFTEKKMLLTNLLKQFLKNMIIVRG